MINNTLRIKNNIGFHWIYIIPVYTILMITSCNFKNNISEKNDSNKDLPPKNTQALLLTQPFEFDASNKDKVTGEYINQKKVTIPTNLSPQNKWIMFEGPILENDLVAYRYYADSRHRFDIYGKLVTELVMDTVGWQYHDIMDWGSDILKVGNSLGIGSPAIYYKDSLYTLSKCSRKDIEIIENGANRSSIRTTFTGLTIENHQLDIVQDWSLQAGEAWSEIRLEVIDGELPKGMHFATGFVKHVPEVIQGQIDDMFYAMNWGEQTAHHERLGMAVMANVMFGPSQIIDDFSHAYFFADANHEVKYKFLTAWERDNNNVTDSKEFKNLVETACSSSQ